MIHLTDGILLVLEYGLAVFAFVDVLRSAETAVPWVPRWGWVIGILVFPLLGAVVWRTGVARGSLHEPGDRVGVRREGPDFYSVICAKTDAGAPL